MCAQICNQTLEQVQKNLEDYLETKRVSFPRCVLVCGHAMDVCVGAVMAVCVQICMWA